MQQILSMRYQMQGILGLWTQIYSVSIKNIKSWRILISGLRFFFCQNLPACNPPHIPKLQFPIFMVISYSYLLFQICFSSPETDFTFISWISQYIIQFKILSLTYKTA